MQTSPASAAATAYQRHQNGPERLKEDAERAECYKIHTTPLTAPSTRNWPANHLTVTDRRDANAACSSLRISAPTYDLHHICATLNTRQHAQICTARHC